MEEVIYINPLTEVLYPTFCSYHIRKHGEYVSSIMAAERGVTDSPVSFLTACIFPPHQRHPIHQHSFKAAGCLDWFIGVGTVGQTPSPHLT